MATRERTIRFAELQRRLAGLPDAEIAAMAAAQAALFVSGHTADEVVRAESAALRDAAGGMPTRELSTFAGAFARRLRNVRARDKRERSTVRPTVSRRSLFKEE